MKKEGASTLLIAWRYLPEFSDLKLPSDQLATLTITQILTHASGPAARLHAPDWLAQGPGPGRKLLAGGSGLPE